MSQQKQTPATGSGRPNQYHNSLDTLKSQLNQSQAAKQNSAASGETSQDVEVRSNATAVSPSAFQFDTIIPPLKEREPTVAVSLYLKKSVHTRLKRTAMESEISMNRLIGNLVERWLDAVDHR
ncbi:MAG: hypothetical protein HQL53_15080 [Magnetococcales bacterium]|nr:hypothetical protein [Magnetococcales bacterium]